MYQTLEPLSNALAALGHYSLGGLEFLNRVDLLVSMSN